MIQHNLRVLIVDDVALNRKLLFKTISGMCTSVEQASDGGMAVSMVMAANDNNAPYDVIFMDSIMPKMNGVVASSILRSQCHFRGLIVGVTGAVAQAEVDEFLEHGADEVLMKPIGIVEIRRCLASTS